MLGEFQQDLATDKSLNPKHVPHYIRWVRDCYSFFICRRLSALLPSHRNYFFPT